MQFDKMILGSNCEFTTDSNVTGLNNNVIVCAGSGSGKTMSIVEPTLLETYNSSLIVTVTKRKIVNKYKSLFVKRGYKVLDMNFANPEQGNVAFNLMEYTKTDSEIKKLAKDIVFSNPKKESSTASDPYWDQTSEILLSSIISYVINAFPNHTFVDVLRVIDHLNLCENGSGITTYLDEAMEAICIAKPNSLAAICWNSFRVLSYKTAACVYSTLTTALNDIFTPEVRKMLLEKESINVEKIASEKTVLFITTSPVNHSLNCLANIIYSQIFKALFEFAEMQPNGCLPIPVKVLCDDFATGGRIVDFPELISIFREKLISTTILVQSEAQLKSMYGADNAKTIINNCDTYVYMGGMDLDTAMCISQRLNVPLDEVLYMPVGNEVVFRRGQQPMQVNRYNILEDERYVDLMNDNKKASFGKRFIGFI